MSVLDASALLAFLLGEPGAAKVERLLQDGAVCSAVNWSEVAQKVRSAQRNRDLSSALLRSYGLIVEPVTERDAEWAARRWTPGEELSVADRLCLALGDRLDTNIWTADRSWGRAGRVRQIR